MVGCNLLQYLRLSYEVMFTGGVLGYRSIVPLKPQPCIGYVGCAPLFTGGVESIVVSG